MARRAPVWRRPSVWIMAMLLAGTVVFVTIRALGPRVPVAIARRHDLEKHVVVSGRVMPPSRIEVASTATGLVTAVGAREGDLVREGVLLVQLDEAEARARIALAEAAVAQARARAERVGRIESAVAGAALDQARTTHDSAEQQLARVEALVATGAAAQQQLDDARRALAIARAQRDLAQAQRIAASARGVDAREAWAGVSQTLAQLTLARIELGRTRVLAPRDSVVLVRDVEPGMVVAPARALMTLAATGDTRLTAQLDERDLPLVRVGMSARASADAFPSRVFDATIDYVAPSVDVQRGSVEVRLRVPSPPSELRPDMTVSIDLEVARERRALVVPSEAVHGLATERPWVLAVVDGRTSRRDVRLGIVGDGSVQVLAGLREGDSVVLPDGQAIRAGQTVRPGPVEER
ncbi:MAG: efflux RND transporter periplasmic adaptor subunit [Deltaproteobacteria bacterium]|nr:efflux RND transporter periplasmic adaptor subunit [Deltaproteobacteria bacterium]